MKAVPAIAATFVVLSAAPGPAPGQEGDAAAGGRLVAAHCNECHTTSGPARGTPPAPSFSAVAQTHSTTSLSLHAFLLTSPPERHMPNYRLTPQDMDDAVAYILGLKGH